MGTLADSVGHKKMLLVGLGVFGIASGIAAFSSSALTLISARAALGVGASMVMPSVLAIIRHEFEDNAERSKALGVWSVIGAAGAAIGPLAGGYLLEHFWWGSIFLINVPIMLITVPLAWMIIPSLPSNPQSSWKIKDTAILMIGLVATVYGAKRGITAGFETVSVFSLLGGMGLLFWFSCIQLAAPSPMLDVKLIIKPVIGAGLLMAFVAAGSLSGLALILAQELQYVLGASPLETGIFMLPLIIAAAVGGLISGWLSSCIGLRPTATISMIVAAIAIYGIAVIDVAEDGLIVNALLGTLGFCLGVGLLASSIAIMGSAPTGRAGAAGALESTAYELGGGLGVTFFGVLANSIYRSSLTDSAAGEFNSIGEAINAATAVGGERGTAIASAAKTAFVDAHSTVLSVSATLIIILAIVVFAMLRGREPGTR